MQFEYRELGKGDYKGLSALIRSVYEDSPRAMFFESMPQEEELKDLFKKKISGMKGRRVVDMVALSEGKIIGECEVVINDKQGVVGVIIGKEHRSKGIGTLLLESCIAAAWRIGATQFYAEVDEENDRAMHFFLKQGFKQRGIRNGKALMVVER